MRDLERNTVQDGVLVKLERIESRKRQAPEDAR